MKKSYHEICYIFKWVIGCNSNSFIGLTASSISVLMLEVNIESLSGRPVIFL